MDKDGLENSYDLCKKVINSSLGKMLIRKGLNTHQHFMKKELKK